MKKIIYFLPLFFCIIGCRPKPLDVVLPDYEPQIVIASQVLPGEVMLIGLTRSFTVLSNEGSKGEADSSTFSNLLIDSALVTIEHSGITDTLVKLADGLYASIQTLDDPGTNYQLRVTDYLLNKTATASAEMLEQIGFDTAYPEIVQTEEDTVIKVHIKFTDPAGDNFYMVNIYSREILEEGLDLNSFFENGNNKVEATKIYSQNDLKTGSNNFTYTLESLDATDSIAVSISNISEGYYDFLKAREKSTGLLTSITNEPINYPSNIKGGLGYFNTHFPDVEYFDLNEY